MFWHVWKSLFGVGCGFIGWGVFLSSYFNKSHPLGSGASITDVQWIQLPLGRFGAEPAASQCHAWPHFCLGFSCVFLWQWENWFLTRSWLQIIVILWQPCQPSSLKALNAVNLFTVVIYDHPAMCCPLLPFLFTPAVRLASLPFPFLIPLPATRRVSLVSPSSCSGCVARGMQGG